MEINTRREKDVIIVSVKGRMGEVSAPEFEERMNELIDDGETKFLVDLEGLEYISSAGLRGLLAAAKILKERNGQIVLSGLMGAVKDVFEISQFISIFTTYETVDSALSEI